MEKIIGACGLVCSECPAFLATRAGDAAAIARVAEEWTKTYATDVRPEHVWCDGCMTGGERACAHAAECEVRACVAGRGLTSCAACADYGCETIEAFLQMVPPARATLAALRAGR